MLEKLFLFLKGYIILELCGESKERFINLCKNKEIEIIHIFSINNVWFCKLRSQDYKKVRSFLSKTGCRTKIRKKCGLPFLLRELGQRKGLVIGSIWFLLIVTQCAGRIWNIEVEGGFLHTREQLLQVLEEELQVYGGVPGDQVDCFEIEKRLRLDYSEIGWISVEKKGCRLFVMLNESVMPKQAEIPETPCHIVAAQDGIVKRLEVFSGVPVVKAGDEVKKGDILISGIVPIVGDYDAVLRNQPVAAVGSVWLESEFSYQAEYATVFQQKNFIKEKNGLEIFLFGRKLISYIPRYSEGEYDIITTDIVPYAFEDYQAPVFFRKYRCMGYELEQKKMTEVEIEKKSEELWQSFLTDWEAQGVEIIHAQYTTELRRNKCMITGNVKACGNFISYQEILEEEWMLNNEYSGDNP